MSQDKTVTIATEYTAMVYQNAWPGYMEQKNFALSRANGVWILSLDADEQVTPELRDEILAELGKPDAKDGYRIPRRSFYQGRWINHSGFYPDKQLRLFRSAKGSWTGGRVHEKVEINGPIGELRSDLLHYPYKGVISGQLQAVNSYSSLFAQDMHEKGERYSWSLLLWRPILKFLEVYVIKFGFLDGVAGLVIAVNSAYAMFVRYVKLRELEKKSEREMPK